MPAAGFIKRTYTGPRPWENTDAAPFSDVADLSRGDTRLAAEVALCTMTCRDVPSFAHERALQTLTTLAHR